MTKKILPFGAWPSAFTPEIISQSTRLSDVQWDSDGASLVWSESRHGKGVLVSAQNGSASRDLSEKYVVRARVGYGGGEFTVNKGHVVFAEHGGRLIHRTLSCDSPLPITPEFGYAASPQIDPQAEQVLYVHSYEADDSLAIVDIEGRQWPKKIVFGSDFYMQPVWHPSGEHIAWIEWDHPNMPWDHSRLCLAKICRKTWEVSEKKYISKENNVSSFQPMFSPKGETLSYIVTQGDREALIALNLNTMEKKILVQDRILSSPAWVQGIRTYAWKPCGTGIYFFCNENGFRNVYEVDVHSGESKRIQIESYHWFDQLSVSPTHDLAMLASSAYTPSRIISFKEKDVRVLRRSSSENIHEDEISCPQAITWTSKNGMTIHGLYYPPKNANTEGKGLPPAILSVHGGPTAQRVASFHSEALFFTNRGYAYLEVNYRGSTGYGKAYMDELKGNWGIYDVEDTVGAAEALIDQQLADPKRLIVKGGSAGGYTVLNSLIHAPGVFKAGVCLFGVSNLFSLARDTHKFESRYLDTLVGPLPDASEKYHAWSPLFHAGKISDAIAIYQGDEDQVVPPNQSESIVAALRAKGVPCFYQLFSGEGHGWRKPETIVEYYSSLLNFLEEHVLFS